MMPRYKPLDRPAGEDTWFCHAPPSPRDYKRPISVYNKPLSQVPDLNNGKECSTLEDQDKKYVRGGFNPNDSKYIRLAKAGGRKHLISFVENPEKARIPQPYPVPDWYCHCEGKVDRPSNGKVAKCPHRPDWMTHLEQVQESDKQEHNPDRGIVAWDQMSAWTREEFERKMQLKAKPSYENRKKKLAKQKKMAKPKTKVNKDDNPSTGGRLKLPKIAQSQYQGLRKLSGNELKVQWYKKWYLAGKA